MFTVGVVAVDVACNIVNGVAASVPITAATIPTCNVLMLATHRGGRGRHHPSLWRRHL